MICAQMTLLCWLYSCVTFICQRCQMSSGPHGPICNCSDCGPYIYPFCIFSFVSNLSWKTKITRRNYFFHVVNFTSKILDDGWVNVAGIVVMKKNYRARE